MRNAFVYTGQLFCKGIAWMLLSLLTMFTYAFSVMVFFYRMVAAVFVAIGACLIAVECYQYGLNAERGLIILALLLAFTLRYLLPMLTSVMQGWQQDLMNYIYAPVSFRRPVRYTI